MKSAVCLVVRNEERDIAEWIAFHALVGFDTQIIFDNRSDDATAAVIRAASGLYDIRYHDWSNRSFLSQDLAYEAACEAYRLEFDWIAFLDSDEFLITTADEPINQFLSRFERWSGVAVNWAIYGSNGHVTMPQSFVVEAFTRRATPEFSPTHHVKPIIRPSFATRCLNPHCFDLTGHLAGSYCNPRGESMEWMPSPAGITPGLSHHPADYSVCRINHYFTRSRAHWLAKLKRGYPSDVAVRTMTDFDLYDRNEIEDPIALRFVPQLQAAVSRIQQRFMNALPGASSRQLLYMAPAELAVPTLLQSA